MSSTGSGEQGHFQEMCYMLGKRINSQNSLFILYFEIKFFISRDVNFYNKFLHHLYYWFGNLSVDFISQRSDASYYVVCWEKWNIDLCMFSGCLCSFCCVQSIMAFVVKGNGPKPPREEQQVLLVSAEQEGVWHCWLFISRTSFSIAGRQSLLKDNRKMTNDF